jgi:hypothetical protein
MRSLKRIFDTVREKNPFWSDYICFAEAVCGRKFSKRTISYYFNRGWSVRMIIQREKRRKF